MTETLLLARNELVVEKEVLLKEMVGTATHGLGNASLKNKLCIYVLNSCLLANLKLSDHYIIIIILFCLGHSINLRVLK